MKGKGNGRVYKDKKEYDKTTTMTTVHGYLSTVTVWEEANKKVGL